MKSGGGLTYPGPSGGLTQSLGEQEHKRQVGQRQRVGWEEEEVWIGSPDTRAYPCEHTLLLMVGGGAAESFNHF